MTGRQLRLALKKLGLTHNAAARWLRSEPSTVHRWLVGDRGIPGPVETAIEVALELRLHDPTYPLKPSK